MVGSSLLGGCTADSTEQEETEICQIKACYMQPYPASQSNKSVMTNPYEQVADPDLHGSTLFWEAGSGSAIE
jgi:hypothetical protein